LPARFDAGLLGFRLLDQANDPFAMPRQHDLLALLHGADQFGQLALGLMDGNRQHILARTMRIMAIL
jgi:hypothetical protein